MSELEIEGFIQACVIIRLNQEFLMDYVKAWIHQAMIINLKPNFAGGASCLWCSKVVAPRASFGFCVFWHPLDKESDPSGYGR